MAEQNSKTGNPSRDKGGKKDESGRCHVVAKGEIIQKFTGMPQLHDDTYINRTALIQHVRAS